MTDRTLPAPKGLIRSGSTEPVADRHCEDRGPMGVVWIDECSSQRAGS